MSTQSITEQRISCPNKSVCQKLTWSCQKWKSTQNAIIRPFLHKSLQFLFFECSYANLCQNLSYRRKCWASISFTWHGQFKQNQTSLINSVWSSSAIERNQTHTETVRQSHLIEVRIDFHHSLMSGHASTFPEQRLVIEPDWTFDY